MVPVVDSIDRSTLEVAEASGTGSHFVRQPGSIRHDPTYDEDAQRVTLELAHEAIVAMANSTNPGAVLRDYFRRAFWLGRLSPITEG